MSKRCSPHWNELLPTSHHRPAVTVTLGPAGLPCSSAKSEEAWHNEEMSVSRESRRIARTPRAIEEFGAEQADIALDLLELVELAWHDVYSDITPSDEIIDDLFVLSEGQLDQLVRAARLAMTDWRDLRVAADNVRGRS